MKGRPVRGVILGGRRRRARPWRLLGQRQRPHSDARVALGNRRQGSAVILSPPAGHLGVEPGMLALQQHPVHHLHRGQADVRAQVFVRKEASQDAQELLAPEVTDISRRACCRNSHCCLGYHGLPIIVVAVTATTAAESPCCSLCSAPSQLEELVDEARQWHGRIRRGRRYGRWCRHGGCTQRRR